MTWVAAVVGVGTLAYGIYQSESAKKEAEAAEKRKKNFEVPKSAQLRQKRLAMREQTQMPGLNAAKENISAGTSNTLDTMRETANQASFQDMINQSLRQQNQQYADLGIKAAQYKLDRQLDTDKGLGDIAGYEEKQQDIARQTEEAKIAAANQKQQAGEANIASGLQMGVQAGAGAKTGGEKKKSTNERAYGDNRTQREAIEDWNKIDKGGQDAILNYRG